MAFRDQVTDSITLPTDAGPNDSRLVIGADIPPELIAAYAVGISIFPPETVLACILVYDASGNYAYQAWVMQANGHLSEVEGSFQIGVIGENKRTYLTYGSSPPYQTLLESNLLRLLEVSEFDQVFGTALYTDVNGDRFTITSEGGLHWGPGGNNPAPAQDCNLYRDAPGVLTVSNLVSDKGGGAAETWHALTLAGGYANQGAPSPTSSYKLYPIGSSGSVEVIGAINAGTSHADGTVVATLPAGYRPSHTHTRPVYCTVATTQVSAINVDSAGNLKIFGCGSNVIGFGFTFPIDL